MQSHDSSVDGRAPTATDNAAASARGSVPIGYLTTDSLAELWNERRRAADDHRQSHPDDLKGIETRQRIASELLRTFRLLADLEQQLGVVLGLPVLGASSLDLECSGRDQVWPSGTPGGVPEGQT